MATCMPSCENIGYMMLNLIGEVGELASKVAKAIRKGEAEIICNDLVLHFDNECRAEQTEEMKAEAGDILWQLSGLCKVMGWSLESVAQANLDKLASRQRRGVIDGNGDNR